MKTTDWKFSEEAEPTVPDTETIPGIDPDIETNPRPRTPYNPWPGNDPNPKA